MTARMLIDVREPWEIAGGDSVVAMIDVRSEDEKTIEEEEEEEEADAMDRMQLVSSSELDVPLLSLDPYRIDMPVIRNWIETL